MKKSNSLTYSDKFPRELKNMPSMPRSHRGDPITSKMAEAGARADGKMKRGMAAILEVLQDKRSYTVREMECELYHQADPLELDLQEVRRRMSDCKAEGLVECSGILRSRFDSKLVESYRITKDGKAAILAHLKGKK